MSNYYNKYIKYKNKYLSLKINQVGGKKNDIIGINYEGGKIISHILNYENCVAYANCQMALDAPYSNNQSKFQNYDIINAKDKLKEIFQYIDDKYKNIKIVIQVARNRSAQNFIDTILMPIINEIEIEKYEFQLGYRSSEYYVPGYDNEKKTMSEFITESSTLSTAEELELTEQIETTPQDTIDDVLDIDSQKFVFVNIGRFGVLKGDDAVEPGEICNPARSYIIKDFKNNTMISDFEVTKFKDDKNILNKMNFKKITIFGISDHMKYITSYVYPKEIIYKMLANIK